MSFSCPPGADLEVVPFTNLLLSQVRSRLAVAIAVPEKPSLGLGFTSLHSASALLGPAHATQDSSSLFKPSEGLSPGSSCLSQRATSVGDFINSHLDILTLASTPKGSSITAGRTWQ